MTAPDRSESARGFWRAYKHWIFDSNDNHVFWPDELNLSNSGAAHIVEEVNKALLAAEERIKNKFQDEYERQWRKFYGLNPNDEVNTFDKAIQILVKTIAALKTPEGRSNG